MDNTTHSFYIVSIDPGLSGYVTILDNDGNYMTHFPNPVIVTSKKVKKRATGKVKTSTKIVLDIPSLVNLLRPYSGSLFAVERQHAMPKQGLASTAKTMYGYGAVLGVGYALGMQMSILGAKEWQKAMLDPSIEDTKLASIMAVKKWNKDLDLRKTKKSRKDDHNLCDSVNIARYIWQTFNK